MNESHDHYEEIIWLPEGFREYVNTPPREVIYHYTTQKGLLGILNPDADHAAIWATKVQYLNDSTEFRLTLDLASQRLQSLDTGDPVRHAKIEAMKNHKGIVGVNIFVTCFCNDGDLLSQWRAYSGLSHGFSIGFKVTKPKQVANDVGFALGRCLYDYGTQVHVMDSIIEYCLSQGRNALGTARLFELKLLMVGAYIKHHKFKEEEEWRLVSSVRDVRSDAIYLREGTSMLIPYIKMPLPHDLKELIDGVIVGPCPHPELSKDSLSLLLRRCGITLPVPRPVAVPGYQTNVSKSAIPFRNW